MFLLVDMGRIRFLSELSAPSCKIRSLLDLWMWSPSHITIMSPRYPLILRLFSLLCIFYVEISHGIKVANIYTESEFVQTLQPKGETITQFDNEEIYHADLESKDASWRLPQFAKVAGAPLAGVLQNIKVMEYNLDIWEKRSNYTKAKSVAQDDIHVFTQRPVVLGEPVSLVCLASRFFPPVIKMRWLKNNQPVTAGVSETTYYPARDGSFSKFLYLITVPEKGDVYTCSVEHDGLTINPTNKFWSPEVPRHVSSTPANVVCGLGLVCGIIGIVVGIALICKGKKNMDQERRH